MGLAVVVGCVTWRHSGGKRERVRGNPRQEGYDNVQMFGLLTDDEHQSSA
jgi:hypothetical protein